MHINITIKREKVDEAILVYHERKKICIPLERNNCSIIINNQQCNISVSNQLHKKPWHYILLWFFNLLIAPINMILMNTASNWYNINFCFSRYCFTLKTPKTKNLSLFLFLSYDSNKQLLAKCFDSTMNSEIAHEKIEVLIDNSKVNWEMNKWLSKFFSYVLWSEIVLCTIFNYANINILLKTTLLYTTIFLGLLIFILVLVYTIKKKNTIKKAYCYKQFNI